LLLSNTAMHGSMNIKLFSHFKFSEMGVVGLGGGGGGGGGWFLHLLASKN
jgi:hypothetical protein